MRDKSYLVSLPETLYTWVEVFEVAPIRPGQSEPDVTKSQVPLHVPAEMNLDPLMVRVPDTHMNAMSSDAQRERFDPLLTERVEAAVRLEKARGTRYQLYAVLVHDGDSPRRGHYYSFVRQRDPEVRDREVWRWYRYNDSATEGAPLLGPHTADLSTPQGKVDEKNLFRKYVAKASSLFWRRMRNEEAAEEEVEEDGEGDDMSEVGSRNSASSS